MSVFMPCFLASFSRAFTSPSCLVDACLDPSFRSTSGSPFHAAPTSHHLPLVSAECKSSRFTRSGSCGTTGRWKSILRYGKPNQNSSRCRVLPSPVRNFFKRSVVSPRTRCAVARLVLLFFKLVNVSNMKRVLELRRELRRRMRVTKIKRYSTLKSFPLLTSYSGQSGRYLSVRSDHPVEVVALSLEASQPQ